MTTRAHAALLIAVPLAFSVLLWFHPMLSDYEDLLGVTARFQIVHLAMVLVVPLLAVGLHVMLDGVNGRAATVTRLALIPFVAFYAPYVAFEGIAVGVLGQELNGLPAAQRDAIAPGMIEDFARNPIVGEPSSSGLWAPSPCWSLSCRRFWRCAAPARRGLPAPARRIGTDRDARPAARPGRARLLRRGGLDGAPGARVVRRTHRVSARRRMTPTAGPGYS